LPTKPPQSSLVLPITLLVRFELRLPKIHTRLGQAIAQLAIVPMPEAAVDEHQLA
jgi:hypothetical protein